MDVIDPKAFWYLGSIPLILGLVQILKQWVTDSRWYPVASLVFGIGLNLLIGHLINQSLLLSALAGFIAAFTASGLYSSGTAYKTPKPPAPPAAPPAGGGLIIS